MYRICLRRARKQWMNRWAQVLRARGEAAAYGARGVDWQEVWAAGEGYRP